MRFPSSARCGIVHRIRPASWLPALAALCCGVLAARSEAAGTERPNLIMIMADDI